jgi:hypothetical protein
LSRYVGSLLLFVVKAKLKKDLQACPVAAIMLQVIGCAL